MIRTKSIAAVTVATLLAGCQMMSGGGGGPSRSQMDGTWASTDGVFVANFSGGSFVSRFTQTNEILAQGTYSVNGPDVTMQWMSAATGEQRSANCSFRSGNNVHCEQTGAGGFDMNRTA